MDTIDLRTLEDFIESAVPRKSPPTFWVINQRYNRRPLNIEGVTAFNSYAEAKRNFHKYIEYCVNIVKNKNSLFRAKKNKGMQNVLKAYTSKEITILVEQLLDERLYSIKEECYH